MEWIAESGWFIYASALQWQNRLDWLEHQVLQPSVVDWVLDHEYRRDLGNEEEKQRWCVYEWKDRIDALGK